MVADGEDKLAFDSQLLDVHLTGLQAEVEAKLRRVSKFREQMQKIDAAGGATDRAARIAAARGLLKRVDEMLKTNLEVRQTLNDIRAAVEAVLKDVQEL